jgi:sarcosine oxidase, subunit beta
MEKTADIVIVGGGIIGVSIAYHLALNKAGRILVLEKGRAGEGSTARCLGGIRTQFSTEIHIRFALESRRRFEGFKEEFGIDPEWKRIGYLFLATTDREGAVFRENTALQRRWGIPVDFLNAEQVSGRWPYLRTNDLTAATFCPWDGYAGVHEVFSGLLQGAKRCGVRISEGEEVTGFTIRGGKVVAVSTRNQEISTEIVVNAAGPYAGEVGKMAGVEIPVKPLRRQIFATAPFHLTDAAVPLTIDFHRGWYFRAEVDGYLLSGPIDKEPSFNLNIDYESMAEASENAMYRVPDFERARVARGWAGLYEISPDNHAILGQAPALKGFFLANGFSGHGFQHSPAVGRVMSELILNGKASTIDISALSLDRFERNELIQEPLTAFKE